MLLTSALSKWRRLLAKRFSWARVVVPAGSLLSRHEPSLGRSSGGCGGHPHRSSAVPVWQNDSSPPGPPFWMSRAAARHQRPLGKSNAQCWYLIYDNMFPLQASYWKNQARGTMKPVLLFHAKTNIGLHKLTAGNSAQFWRRGLG